MANFWIIPEFRSTIHLVGAGSRDSGREGCTVTTCTVTAEPRNWYSAIKIAVQEGGPVHETPTKWGLGRANVRNLNPARGEVVSGFEPVTTRSQGSNFTVAPRLTLLVLMEHHVKFRSVDLKEFGVKKGELARYLDALLKDSEQLAAMIDNVSSVDNQDFIMETDALGHKVMDQSQGHESLVAITRTPSLK